MARDRKARTLRDWLVATRPWSFPASIMPILIMWAYLLYWQQQTVMADNSFNTNWPIALLCLPLIVLMHAGGNMVSDYNDWKRHVDAPGGPNGVTWIFDGTFQPREILYCGYVLLFLAAALGIAILASSTWEGLWIGAFGLALAAGYPWMKAHLLGDVNILASFALLPAIGTSLVSTGHYHPETMFYILPIGCLTVGILHANNTRDINSDSKAGLATLCGVGGPRLAKAVYHILTFAPYILTLVYSLSLNQPATILIVWLTLPLAIRNSRKMANADEMMVNQIPDLDKLSAQLQTIFGILYALGFSLPVFINLISH